MFREDENIIKLRHLLAPILLSEPEDNDDDDYDFEAYDTPCGY